MSATDHIMIGGHLLGGIKGVQSAGNVTASVRAFVENLSRCGGHRKGCNGADVARGFLSQRPPQGLCGPGSR
jgi:hypothetical protein